jgi:trk system potassium uptake protein TrkH
LTLDTKLILVMDLALIVVVAAMLIGVEWSRALASAPAWARPMAALFLSVSTRSGGFTTVDLGEANAASIFVMIVSMAIGGAPASTAGGVRLTTVAVIGVAVLATLRGQSEPHVFGRRIAITLVLRAIAVVFLFLVAHAVATVALALTENVAGGDNLGFIDLMFEAMSALATAGLSTGVTPGLTTAGKVVLCITMFLGRVGPLTVVYALQRRLSPDRHRFPEESVRIG